MQKISLFSSDKKQLYKEDIYRALALPNEYILQFRYPEKYIEENLLLKIQEDKFDNKEAVIFFSRTTPLDTNNYDIANISIRECQILEYFKSETTGLYHFYLKLGDFKEYSIDSNNAKEKYPPTKFVSELNLTIQNSHSWKDRVLSVKDSFNEKIFFNITNITNPKGKIQKIESYSNKISQFILNEDDKYSLNLSIYEKDENDDHIKVSGDDKVILNISSMRIRSGAEFDDKSILMVTKPINSNKTTNIVHFEVSSNDKLSCELSLQFLVNKSLKRSIIFFVFSTFLFLTLSMNSFFIDPTKQVIFIFNGWSICAALLFGFSVTLLFRFFDKK